MKQLLITVAGRNSAGKSLIAKKVAEALGLNVVKSYATRKPRPEELQKGLENCDHIFISDEEYDKLENITAETEINGARYCTTQDILDKSDIYVIDPKGIKDLKERCGNRYKILQFYIYADADKRAARFVARGETKAKFEAREQSEDEQFCDYENNHGWDIIIYNNWDIDTAVKTMLGYVRPIMTPVIEARQKQAEEGFEKMMNPPVKEKQDDEPADEQAGMKEQQEKAPKAENEQTEDVPAEEMPDKEACSKDSHTEEPEADGEQVEDEVDDSEEQQNEEPETEKLPAEKPEDIEEQQAESEMQKEDGEKLEEYQNEGVSNDDSEAPDSSKPSNDPFSLDFDDEDEDFMDMPAGVDKEKNEDNAAEDNSDAADPFSLNDFDNPDEENTNSSDEPEKFEKPDDIPEDESEPAEEPVDETVSEPVETPAEENPGNVSETQEEPEKSSDDKEDDDGEAILID